VHGRRLGVVPERDGHLDHVGPAVEERAQQLDVEREAVEAQAREHRTHHLGAESLEPRLGVAQPGDGDPAADGVENPSHHVASEQVREEVGVDEIGALARDARGDRDVVAADQPVHDGRDVRHRVGEVAVGEDRVPPTGAIETDPDGEPLPAVRREAHGADRLAGVGAHERGDDLLRSVLRAVVDDEQLPGLLLVGEPGPRLDERGGEERGGFVHREDEGREDLGSVRAQAHRGVNRTTDRRPATITRSARKPASSASASASRVATIHKPSGAAAVRRAQAAGSRSRETVRSR